MHARTLTTRALAVAAAVTAGLMPACNGMATADTDGEGGVLSGNQVVLPINLPVDLTGNAVAAAGNAEAESDVRSVSHAGTGAPKVIRKTTTKAAHPRQGRPGAHKPRKGVHKVKITRTDVVVRDGAGPRTSGAGGVLSGNQVLAPITAPITACGNAVAILGVGRAGCKANVNASSGGGHAPRTSGRGGVLSGNQVLAPITAPITACGNAVGVPGVAEAGCKAGVAASSGGGGATGSVTVKTKKHGKPKEHGKPRKHGKAKPKTTKHASRHDSRVVLTGNGGPGSGNGAAPVRLAAGYQTGGPAWLPRTGAPLWLLGASAGAALTLGAGLLLAGRRRNRQTGHGGPVTGPLAKGGGNES
ncbi:chaplin family protein [Spirillospora sp. NPDC048911]|uniref:chaplin family protein n=1 Tax=Spirillospora sp. NPDC048911 TaxID=3364527 RepID=UPI0037160C0B